MNKFFILFAFIAMFGFGAVAQDVILKQDGSEINTKVLEITDQQIKYKEFDFQDGPTRNINISDVFMITYENGKKDVEWNWINTQFLTPKAFFILYQKNCTFAAKLWIKKI